MKRLRLLFLLPVMLLSVAAVGPASCDRSVFEGGDSLTASVVNPARPVDIYRVKTVYASASEIVVAYREYCWSASYKVLMENPIAKQVCARRRPITRAMIAADRKAEAAIVTAENFIRDNPRLSATSAILAAWRAVTDFQRLATDTAVSIAAN